MLSMPRVDCSESSTNPNQGECANFESDDQGRALGNGNLNSEKDRREYTLRGPPTAEPVSCQPIFRCVLIPEFPQLLTELAGK